MIVRIDPDYLEHASKSKYKGGFVNGKNTSAYNHDYYMKNKEKWKDNNEDGDDGDRSQELDRINNMPEGAEKDRAMYNYWLKEHPQKTVFNTSASREKTALVSPGTKNMKIGKKTTVNGVTLKSSPSHGRDRKGNSVDKTATVSGNGPVPERGPDFRFREDRAPSRKRNDSGKSATVSGRNDYKDSGVQYANKHTGRPMYNDFDGTTWYIQNPPKKRRKGKKPIGHVVLK